MALLLGAFGVIILGLIVFGGGQVFMPLFKSLWTMMSALGADIDDQKIDTIFTVANSTPGVVSTKFGLFTGYLAANGEWWGWLALILTYLLFALPSIFMIVWASKLVTRSEQSKHLKLMTTYLKPVIAGIVIALAVQLFIGTAFPKLVFNSTDKMFGTRTTIFTGWRLTALIIYSIIVSMESAYLYGKKKVNLFLLIAVHIILGFLIFQPWFM